MLQMNLTATKMAPQFLVIARSIEQPIYMHADSLREQF